jgi:hypothetical protein
MHHPPAVYCVDRDFEPPAYIQYETTFRDPGGWYHQYHEDGVMGNIPTDDWEFGEVYLAAERAYSGARSLAMKSLANRNSLKDRVEIEIANWSRPDALKFGQTRYVSYRLYIDDDSGVFPKHFTQVWQANCAAKVPFTMTFDNSQGDWRWEAAARSFTVLDRFAGQTISKGQWHQFVFKFSPQFAEAGSGGEICIWLDGRPAGTYRGPWGEMPGHQWPGYDPVTDGMSIRCGLYAGPGGVFHPYQGLCFDNCRMGTAFDDVYTEADRLEFEAESGILTPPWKAFAHSDASFGCCIEEPDGVSGAGSAEYSFELSEAGTFNIWLLAYGETGNDDSVFVSLNDEPNRYCGISTGASFSWRNLREVGSSTPLAYSLSAGSHVLRLINREPGASIDRVVIVEQSQPMEL